jgi:hypothetical protein
MEKLQARIARICKMEQYFDEVAGIVRLNTDLLHHDESVKTKLNELVEYYEGGLWLQDYECDERGELPSDLKRGVLSEDGLYNLLSDVENTKIESYEEL